MGIISEALKYEWKISTEKGRFRGIELAYRNPINTDKAFRSVAEIFYQHKLKTEIRYMNAYVSGAPLSLTDTPLRKFQRYLNADIKIKDFTVIGKEMSWKEAMLWMASGAMLPYVLIAVDDDNFKFSSYKLKPSRVLDILESLSKELALKIPMAFIEKDIESLKSKK